MANPQPDQFTRIANELLDMIPKYKFNGTQLRLVMVVWRYTYGFQRKQHDFSLSFLLEALGLNIKQLKQVKREVDKLIEFKVLIEVQEPTKYTPRILTFNKDYDEWTIQTTGQIRPLDKLDHSEGAKKTTQPLDKLDHQERKVKENSKESSRSDLPPQLNNLNLKRISKVYQENGFGMIYPKAGQDLLDLVDNYTIEWVELAMEKAGKLGKRNTGYVEGILKGWKSDGQPNMDGKQKDKDDHIKLIR